MLNQLSSLSSPPLSITPLTIISSGQRDEHLAALQESAPSAVVRIGSRSSHRALTNSNTVIVLDRCGRMVYQQTLQQSDTNLQSVEAAILSAHLDEPCGPCHLPQSQEELSRGRLEVQDETTSQAKMSRIAGAYASSDVANNPTDDARNDKAVEEETLDDRRGDSAQEEVVAETTTRKPERKTKKNKRKKGKQEKQKKKRKQGVEEAVMTSTSKPEECVCATQDCECAIRADTTDEDDILRLIGLSETANEVLSIRDLGYLAVQTSESTAATFLPSSRIIWAGDKQTQQNKKRKQIRTDPDGDIDEAMKIIREEQELVKNLEVAGTFLSSSRSDVKTKQTYKSSFLPSEKIKWARDIQTPQTKNGKQSRADLDREIDEGIEIVREEEELVEYPDDNVLAEIEKAAEEGRLLGREESHQGAENGLSQQDGGAAFTVDDDRDEKGLIVDVVPDEGVVIPDEHSYPSERDDEEQSRRELMGSDSVWGTYKQDESKDIVEKKKQKMSKDVAKKGKKEGKYKKVEKAEEEEQNFDWVGSDEADSQEFVLQWGEGEVDGGRVAEGETDGGRIAEREPEPTARFATWREVTIAPTVHDSRSSGDSEDQSRRVVVYESEGEDSASDKVEQLHSKVNPWVKGKHF